MAIAGMMPCKDSLVQWWCNRMVFNSMNPVVVQQKEQKHFREGEHYAKSNWQILAYMLTEEV